MSIVSTSRSKIKPGINDGQHEYWGFTQFFKEFKLMDITDPAVTYYVYQMEQCPKTGSFHWQGYIEVDAKVRMTTVLKLINSTTAEVYYRKGTQQEMIAYCTKTEETIAKNPNWFCWAEKGLRVKHEAAGPYSNGTPRTCEQGKRSDLQDLCDIIINGGSTHDVMRQYPAAFMRYDRHIEKFYTEWYSQDKYKRSFEGNESCNVIVLVGEGGLGKSKELYQIASSEPFYEKTPTTKWWDGYKGENTVVINDYRGSFLIEDFIRLLDRYQYQGEVKGGAINIRAKRFIITSNLEPEKWYPNVDYNTLIGVLRRISTLIYISTESRIIENPKEYYDARFTEILKKPPPTIRRAHKPPPRKPERSDRIEGTILGQVPKGITIPSNNQSQTLFEFD